ncbi:WD40-repeat-containing domain protein [Baffinella frigidus]|nr:WD40-repeat-containing domain protein [Cryptophyta sp. CCMP2293]
MSGEVQMVCSLTGEERATLYRDEGCVLAVELSEDGSSVASADSWGWSVCEVPSGRIRMCVRLERSDGAVLVEAAFSPCLSWVAAARSSCHNHVVVCCAETGEVETLLKGHTCKISAVRFSPDGTRIASGDCSGNMFLWDAGTGSALRRWPDAHAGSVRALSLHGGLLASGGRDNYIKLWDSESGAPLRTFAGHVAEVTSVAFAPGGKAVASGGLDRSVRVWCVESGKAVLYLQGHDARGVCRCQYWSPRPLLCSIVGHQDWVSSVCFSGDGSLLASSSRDGSCRVWDLATGEGVRAVNTGAWVRCVAFGRDCVQVEDRRRAMQEAFAMGLVDRLGAASRMHVLRLEPGVVRMVLEGV